MLTMKSIKRVVKTKNRKLKKSPDKNKIRDSNRSNTKVTARKQNDKRSQKSFEFDQDEVRDNKTPKKDIAIIGDSIIKYMSDREISRSSSVKIRSHPGATTQDLIDYVRPTARIEIKMIVQMTSEIKSKPSRKLEQ